MLTMIRSASLKTQFLLAVCFILGYFSPLLAIFIFLFVKVRHLDMIYAKLSLYGAIVALLLYTMDYAIYLYA